VADIIARHHEDTRLHDIPNGAFPAIATMFAGIIRIFPRRQLAETAFFMMAVYLEDIKIQQGGITSRIRSLQLIGVIGLMRDRIFSGFRAHSLYSSGKLGFVCRSSL